jgi:hypothetical protein
VDLVHRSIDQFRDFSFRKIISLIPENPGFRYFTKTTPKLFQNYILVPVILYLSPCLTFYNYDLVPALINLIYFNYLFNLLTLNLRNLLIVALI